MEPTTCVDAEPFALRVTDDSMAPEFMPGCIIIVDPAGVARDGVFVLADDRGGWILRRLRLVGDGVRLEPLNPSFPVVKPSDGMRAVRGVIVQRAGIRRSEHKRYS